MNWELVDTSRKYLNNAWLLDGFKVGVGTSYRYRGNINDLPTSATLRIASVPSIEEMFHMY